ncbi:unnamed protein product [Lactuca saligna]|uniref:Uncharacterized protein n=1 Tax=Lactuca saligna TaxID=75948 RepID=A0AA35VJX3_LACSI|nr:unnamed protein product [Lactuca saligna]
MTLLPRLVIKPLRKIANSFNITGDAKDTKKDKANVEFEQHKNKCDCGLDLGLLLSNGAKRGSRASSEWRSEWCAFVKSANTVYEMVEATMVLETMIKTDYVNTWWWYWSSMAAAAKTSSISVLALRIYTPPPSTTRKPPPIPPLPAKNYQRNGNT